MYLDKIKGLENYVNKFPKEYIHDLEFILNNIYISGFSEQFNPNVFSYFVNLRINFNLWIELLSKLYINDLVEREFNTTCSFCDETISSVKTIDKIQIDRRVLCRKCNHYIIVSTKFVIIMYSFTSKLEDIIKNSNYILIT